ncbi:hypothetical protein [Microbacterium sp. G2-8]|uniref:hypothetical protein n=1 Tax=Microbacterium sp. G2-8 TaxID=2842454 RepID=UPI001C8A573B|nr:hypothetical protein [Microbacterium sp. G2-8]
MPTPRGDRTASVPTGTRLLHIGMPKTGTTALQTTASRQRDALVAHGVRYPGDDINHRRALLAKLGVVWGWGEGAAVPGMRPWHELEREISGGDTSRIWLDHEFCATARRESAAQLIDALGGPVHVVVTFRPIPAYVASAWQQYLKSGLSIDLDTWMHRVLDGWPALDDATPSFGRRIDYAGVVEKWASLVGPENVTAIVLDPADRSVVSETFEDLLELPRGMLDSDARTDAFSLNRGFSWEEAEVMLRLNQAIERGGGLPWPEYSRTVRHGVVNRLLTHHAVGADERRVLVPRWAADRASEIARGQLERIRASGIAIVGDLDLIAAQGETAELERPSLVPAAVADDAVSGAVSAAAGRGWTFEAWPEQGKDPAKDEARVRESLRGIRTRRLVQEIARRVAAAARQRRDAIRRATRRR